VKFYELENKSYYRHEDDPETTIRLLNIKNFYGQTCGIVIASENNNQIGNTISYCEPWASPSVIPLNVTFKTELQQTHL